MKRGNKANSTARTPFRWPISYKGLAMLLIGAGALLKNAESVNADGNLFFRNTLSSSSVSNSCQVKYSSNSLARDYKNGRDSENLAPLSGDSSIYSLLEGYKLGIDERTNNPTNLPFKIKTIFNGENPSDATNILYFTFPSPSFTFDGKNITLQECDSNDVPFGPSYDIRDTIANSNGFLNIGTLATGTYDVNVPYKHFLLWITTAPVQTYSVAISSGVFSVSPTNFSGVPAGGSVTTTVENIYVTNSPGVREKFVGFQKVE